MASRIVYRGFMAGHFQKLNRNVNSRIAMSARATCLLFPQCIYLHIQCTDENRLKRGLKRSVGIRKMFHFDQKFSWTFSYWQVFGCACFCCILKIAFQQNAQSQFENKLECILKLLLIHALHTHNTHTHSPSISSIFGYFVRRHISTVIFMLHQQPTSMTAPWWVRAHTTRPFSILLSFFAYLRSVDNFFFVSAAASWIRNALFTFTSCLDASMLLIIHNLLQQ